MHGRAMLLFICAGTMSAGVAAAQAPSADTAVGLMIQANQGWLTPSIESLSYRLELAPLPSDSPDGADRRLPPAWSRGAAVQVYYRAGRHLRAELAGGGILILPAGQGYRYDDAVRAEEWHADRVLQYLSGIGYLGAAWELAHNRDQWALEEPTRETMNGRDCLRLHGERRREPLEPDRQVPIQEWYRYDGFDLWLDAETHIPLRESLARGEYLVWWSQYLDYRPMPGGGQAPMRINVYTGAMHEYLPGAAARGVYEYTLIDGKVWFLRRWHDLSWSVTVSDSSIEPISIAVFYDERTLNSLARAAELERDLDVLRQGQRWEELLKTCVEITQSLPGHRKANELLRILYFWHGDYEKSIAAAAAAGFAEDSAGDIYLAWAYDAVGRRDDAVRTYRRVIEDQPDEEVTAAAKAGLERPWVPIARRLRPAPGEIMADRGRGWRARASHNQGAAAFAIDGDRGSRWVSGQSQEAGMWLSVDLGKPVKVSRLVFDHVGELTMYYRDYPRRYAVEISVDGDTWRQVAEGMGPPDALVEARFDPQTARHVRIRQEGSARPYHWSVYEVYVYAPAGD